jgi:hypothetical protein
MATAHFQATDYIERAALDHLFSVTAYTQPAHLYLALSTTTPTEAGGNFTEPSGNGYARITVDDWDAPTAVNSAGDATFGGSLVHTLNTTVKTFPAATGAWGTPTYAGIYDASTAGNLLWYGLTGGGSPSVGQAPSFAAGTLRLELERESTFAAACTWVTSVKTAMLNHFSLRATYSPPSPLYAGFCSTLSLTAETYTENADASYVRKSMSGRWGAASTSGGSSTTKNTGADIVWGPATTLIGSRLCLFDASSGGNLIAWCRDPLGGFSCGAGETITLKASGISAEFF